MGLALGLVGIGPLSKVLAVKSFLSFQESARGKGGKITSRPVYSCVWKVSFI